MDVWGWEGTKALERHRLLVRVCFAAELGDRRYADRVMVKATRWLKHQVGDDPVVREARKQLRGKFPAVH